MGLSYTSVTGQVLKSEVLKPKSLGNPGADLKPLKELRP
jgi:hypothetical protein